MYKWLYPLIHCIVYDANSSSFCMYSISMIYDYLIIIGILLVIKMSVKLHFNSTFAEIRYLQGFPKYHHGMFYEFIYIYSLKAIIDLNICSLLINDLDGSASESNTARKGAMTIISHSSSCDLYIYNIFRFQMRFPIDNISIFILLLLLMLLKSFKNWWCQVEPDKLWLTAKSITIENLLPIIQCIQIFKNIILNI